MESRGTGGKSSVRRKLSHLRPMTHFLQMCHTSSAKRLFLHLFSLLCGARCGSETGRAAFVKMCANSSCAISSEWLKSARKPFTAPDIAKKQRKQSSDAMGWNFPLQSRSLCTHFALHNKSDNCLRSQLLSNGSKVWKFAIIRAPVDWSTRNGGFGAILSPTFLHGRLGNQYRKLDRYSGLPVKPADAV